MVKMAEKINPRNFGEGFSEFNNYLGSELYAKIDDYVNKFSGKLPEEVYERVEDRHKEYRGALEEGNEQMKDSIGKIDELFRKAKDIKTKEEAEKIDEELNEKVNYVITISAQLYGLLNPKLDLSELVNKFYTRGEQEMDIGGLDEGVFERGAEILKKYFLTDEIIGRIKKNRS